MGSFECDKLESKKIFPGAAAKVQQDEWFSAPRYVFFASVVFFPKVSQKTDCTP